ncbi:prepilin-type N-terminal cleavage/methylation domain-containing protein [Candidatus Babeliales bacterium]|nr:prepilin-type N-terminal cleavage/methylation domain-containing protein [Candidatus Babeliales bacterium]
MLKKYKAFSLIECLIVITIIVILTSITIPTIKFIDKKILNAEVTNLYTTFNYLRQKAIASNKVLELKFNKEKNSYQYFVNSKEIFIKIWNLELCLIP